MTDVFPNYITHEGIYIYIYIHIHKMFNHIPFLCLHLSILKSIFSNHSSDLMTDDTFLANKTTILPFLLLQNS